MADPHHIRVMAAYFGTGVHRENRLSKSQAIIPEF
jgi:hypothetical protein